MLQYKCPKCAGALEFESNSGNVKCQYCDTEFSVEVFEELDKELDETVSDNIEFETLSQVKYDDVEMSTMVSLQCESCGAEIVTDATTSASSCPYCGNSTIMMGNLKGDLKPELIIPFKLKKEDAMAGFKSHMEGKKFLPKAFVDAHHLEEVKGMYVPFWLFDSTSLASIKFHATKVTTYSDSQYDVTETEHFSVFRSGEIKFANVPVDGSKKIDNAMMESLEPYDISAAVPFKTAYLAGFYADKYDVTSDDCSERAGQRMSKSTAEEFKGTVTGYSDVTSEEVHIDVKNGKARYALLPVWILTTKWNDATYTFAMNGQTGHFVGDLPCDDNVKRKYFYKTFALVFAIATLIQMLFKIRF